VAEEPEAGPIRDPLKGDRHRLQLRMVGSDAEANEPPRRGQPLEHVDLDRQVRIKQRAGRVEPRRPGADHGHAPGCPGTAVRPGARLVVQVNQAAGTVASDASTATARSCHAAYAFRPVYARITSAFSGWSQPRAGTPSPSHASSTCRMNRPTVIPP